MKKINVKITEKIDLIICFDIGIPSLESPSGKSQACFFRMKTLRNAKHPLTRAMQAMVNGKRERENCKWVDGDSETLL